MAFPDPHDRPLNLAERLLFWAVIGVQIFGVLSLFLMLWPTAQGGIQERGVWVCLCSVARSA